MQQHQHVGNQHQTGLERLGHNVSGARGLQILQLRIVGRTHQNGDLRTQLPDAAQNADRRVGIREADDHGAGLLESRLVQHFLIR